MIIGFYTFGCKVNQYETQAMEQLLLSKGHQVGTFNQPCDGYVINTCSVTAMADRKNRSMIRRCRREHPDAVLGVCGCYPQHSAAVLAGLGIDVIGGSGQREDFIEEMISAIASRKPKTLVDNALKRRTFEILPAGGLDGRTRAMLKVQDGCVNFCTYCIIPYTRGPVRSAPLDLVLSQAKDLGEKGYRELVITGIEIASWGVDLPEKPGLTFLISQICQALPHIRIRLGSLEPRIITEDFCRELKKYPNLCPQFHLSLQSGCDSVLRRMGRKYDTRRYLESVNLLKDAFPGCAITTDMIVAFPGETEKEFSQSLSFMDACGFADMHIFPYSRRPGTPADKMPGQLPNAVKEARSAAAIQKAAVLSRNYREGLLGQRFPVLFEEKQGEFFVGHAPNYVKVYTRGKNLHNEIKFVAFHSLYEDGVIGE